MNEKELVGLLAQAKQGDAEAFAKIYTRYAQSIYYLGLKITKNEHDAQDIVQDTMYKVYKSLHTVRNGKSLGAFVNRIAYNTCISAVRGKVEFSTEDEILNLQIESDTGSLPEENFANKETEEAITNAVDDLNISHRTVILLYYYEKLSIKKIADLLDISQQAVKNRLFRAKENIKNTLKHSSLKGVVLFAVLFPALSNALVVEANESFSPVVHQEIWTKLGSQIGYSALEISTAASIVVAKHLVTPLSTIKTKRYISPSVAVGVTVITGLVVAGAVTIGGYNYNIIDNPTKVIPYQQPIELYTDTPTSESVSAPSPTPIDDGEGLEVVEESSVISSTAPVNPEVINPPTIFIENKMPLRYPAGADVAHDQIIADAKIVISENSKLKFIAFEDVNFKNPGEYAIYLQAIGDDGANSEMVAIIIQVY